MITIEQLMQVIQQNPKYFVGQTDEALQGNIEFAQNSPGLAVMGLNLRGISIQGKKADFIQEMGNVAAYCAETYFGGSPNKALDCLKEMSTEISSIPAFKDADLSTITKPNSASAQLLKLKLEKPEIYVALLEQAKTNPTLAGQFLNNPNAVIQSLNSTPENSPVIAKETKNNVTPVATDKSAEGDPIADTETTSSSDIESAENSQVIPEKQKPDFLTYGLALLHEYSRGNISFEATLGAFFAFVMGGKMLDGVVNTTGNAPGLASRVLEQYGLDFAFNGPNDNPDVQNAELTHSSPSTGLNV